MAVEYVPLQTSDGDEQPESKERLRPTSRYRKSKSCYVIGISTLLILICLLLIAAPPHVPSQSTPSSASAQAPELPQPLDPSQSLESSEADDASQPAGRPPKDNRPGFKISEYAHYEYWKESVGKPKKEDAKGHIDHMAEHPEDVPSPILSKSIAAQ